MNIRILCGAVILGISLTTAPTLSPAQSGDKSISAAKDAGAPATTSTTGSATPNTNTNPRKHRHWRHRGGKHPHYGSRRVGS